ncbi:hypothetical protein OG21DRAFT_1527467 [Imleria badia]|nr:hypothetical protein OG21DRAFT_1527467 [Imleria badia]
MSFTIPQHLFINDSTVITVVKTFVGPHRTAFLVIPPCKQCQLFSIAFSTLLRVPVVNVPAFLSPNEAEKRRRVARSRGLIQDHLLLHSKLQKYAFRMLVRINDAVDMLSYLHSKNVQSLFFNTSKSPTIDAAPNVALEAWGTCRAVPLSRMSSRFMSLPKNDTKAFPNVRLDALKPSNVKNDVANRFTLKKSVINLICGHFPTRTVNKSGYPDRNRELLNGAHIKVNEPVQSDTILSATTIGKDNPTVAESTCQDVILGTLQHKTIILLARSCAEDTVG